ncbi:MerC domain-containing protein [Nannocystaceae bacterium ST9]
MTDPLHASHRHARPSSSNLGAFLSMACAVHCMAVPFLLLALPNLGELLTSDLEWLMAIAIAGLTIPAGINAWRAKANWAIAGFVAGFALLSASFVLGHEHAEFDHAASFLATGLAIGGSLLLASAHWHTQRRLACC